MHDERLSQTLGYVCLSKRKCHKERRVRDWSVVIVNERELRLIGSGDLLYTHGNDKQSRWQGFISTPATPYKVNIGESGVAGRLEAGLW